MNLTKVSKKLIIAQFVEFQRSVDECAAIYGKRRDQIETVLREWIVVESSANRLRAELPLLQVKSEDQPIVPRDE